MAGQLWAVNTLGGYFYSLNLSDELRVGVQPLTKFRQFADVKDASQQGKKKGDTFTWDVVGDVSTRGTTLVETSTIPETQFTISQGTLTITEYGNAVPYSGKLEDLGKFAVRDVVMKALRRDASKVMDCAAHAQFNATPLRVVPTGGTATDSVTLTTNGTATLTNNVAFGKNHVKAIYDVMKERNIPGYEGDDYFALGWPTTFRTMKNDIESLHQYTDRGLTMIMAGEIGRYEKVRFVEQTNIPKGGAADSATFNPFTNTADAWNNAKSDWIFFFGEETVAEGIAVPEEIRAKIPTDYGRSKGVAWYYLGGFGLVHTTAAQARVVKWDSAA
jgi:N4-gp56 family major capsid protein